jgi:hypothetical protein
MKQKDRQKERKWGRKKELRNKSNKEARVGNEILGRKELLKEVDSWKK